MDWLDLLEEGEFLHVPAVGAAVEDGAEVEDFGGDHLAQGEGLDEAGEEGVAGEADGLGGGDEGLGVAAVGGEAGGADVEGRGRVPGRG